ncbi:hypothetical protein GOODEAATRI_019369 [Goodea atripinnis]|uniref:Uncharacterized protein n=1 Tax=Goodea atripinnis TaxID=208336 RepID=A0ABV0NZC7_9TELE
MVPCHSPEPRCWFHRHSPGLLRGSKLPVLPCGIKSSKLIRVFKSPPQPLSRPPDGFFIGPPGPLRALAILQLNFSEAPFLPCLEKNRHLTNTIPTVKHGGGIML